MSCQKAPGPDGPAALPVEGKVLFTRGGDVTELAGSQAVVEFQSIDRPDVLAFAELLEDGSLGEVGTLDEGQGRTGLIEGKHWVRINVDDSAAHLLDPRFLNFRRSGVVVKVPAAEPIEIKVWR
jgi:hypothetical protein